MDWFELFAVYMKMKLNELLGMCFVIIFSMFILNVSRIMFKAFCWIICFKNNSYIVRAETKIMLIKIKSFENSSVNFLY